MAKIDTVVLKLTGKKTYLTPLLYSIPFNKGDVIRMPLEIAGKIAGLHERREEQNIYHFTNVTNQRNAVVTHDVTTADFLAELKEMGKNIDKPRLAELALVNREAREVEVTGAMGVQVDRDAVANLMPEGSAGGSSDDDSDDYHDEDGGEDTGSPDGGPTEDSADVQEEQPAAKPASAKPAAKTTGTRARAATGQRKPK